MIRMKKHDIAFGIVLVLTAIIEPALNFFAPINIVIADVLVLLQVIFLVLLVYIYFKYMRN